MNQLTLAAKWLATTDHKKKTDNDGQSCSKDYSRSDQVRNLSLQKPQRTWLKALRTQRIHTYPTPQWNVEEQGCRHISTFMISSKSISCENDLIALIKNNNFSHLHFQLHLNSIINDLIIIKDCSLYMAAHIFNFSFSIICSPDLNWAEILYLYLHALAPSSFAINSSLRRATCFLAFKISGSISANSIWITLFIDSI